MTDTITLPRATVQQALEALDWSTPFQDATVTHSDAITALRAALEQQAEPCQYCGLSECDPKCMWIEQAPQQQAEPVQEPFDDLATELFVVAQRSPADEGFSDTIDRIESWLREHFSTQPQRKPLTDEEIIGAMHEDGCERIENFYVVGPVQKAAVFSFARAIQAKLKQKNNT